MGTGNARMTISVTILITAVDTQRVLNSMQCPPGMVRSHTKLTGLHWNKKIKNTMTKQQRLKIETA